MCCSGCPRTKQAWNGSFVFSYTMPGVLLCIAVYYCICFCFFCRVLQCVEEVWGRSHVVSCTQPSVLQCVTKYCDVLRCVAVCCGVLHRAEKAQERARCESCLRALSLRCSVLRCVAVCCIEQRRHRTKQDVSLADMHSHYVTEVRYGMFVAG